MNRIAGRYSLIKHGTYDSSGLYKASSDYLKGEINYSSDGSLSVLILFKPEIEPKNDILSYLGTYHFVTEETLSHNITLCSNQARNNSSEMRTFKLSGTQLILGNALANGSRFEAIWERISP